MNLELSQKVLQNLASQGVQDLCLCPGARNAPFVEILSQQKSFNVLTFFDERSAAFFALGRARRDCRPVAVLTTSGTAVAELLPATIEAYYTNTPLVLITADRPKRLRGTGAPQSIDQSNLFAGHVEKSWDIEKWDQVDFSLEESRPYHINVCFDEPLLSGDFSIEPIKVKPPHFIKHPAETSSVRLNQALIVVGALRKAERDSVANWLSQQKVPQFYESASGLRNHPLLAQSSFVGGEKMVSQILKSGVVENVVRIGDIPLGRFWRDLDQMEIPVHSFSDKNFAGTDKSNLQLVDLAKWTGPFCEPWDWQDWQSQGADRQQKILELAQEWPLSEVGFVKAFHDSLTQDESFYVGNSLPIRLWDLICDQPRGYRSNRGVNGIDGQLSTALGWMKPGTQNKILVGDLTALYDFNGLWVTPFLKELNIEVELIVLNNQGGKIFSRIFSNPLFENQHQLNFKAMADFWGWSYSRIEDPQNFRPTGGLHLTEWVPSGVQNQMFWDRYDQLWKK